MAKVIETINGKDYERWTNPVKAIRRKCVDDCCAGSVYEADNCLCPSCPIFPFRFGKNPYRTKRKLTDEEKSAIFTRLHKRNAEEN